MNNLVIYCKINDSIDIWISLPINMGVLKETPSKMLQIIWERIVYKETGIVSITQRCAVPMGNV